ncbi:MAG: hypothetical protein ACRDYY_10765 [Acidimicrobiales bacterium]
MAQHQNPGSLGGGAHAVDRQDLDEAKDQAVEEAERHAPARIAARVIPGQVGDRVVGPFRTDAIRSHARR